MLENAKENTSNDKAKNILLLSMSVINERAKPSFYYYKNHNIKQYFAGVSSLEPGTKRIIMELAQKQETLDGIYILCSEESKDMSEFHHEMKGEPCNSVDYYKKRIESFLRGELDDELGVIGQDIFEADKQMLEDMIDDKLQTLVKADGTVEEDTERELKAVIQEIWIQFDIAKKAKEDRQNKTIAELNIDEEEKALLINYLRTDSHEIKVEHYAQLVQKYQKALSEVDDSEDVMSKLRYRNYVFARLRYKYELELYKDNQAQKLIHNLYQEIENLNKEIEKLKPDYKNKVKEFIQYSLIRKLYGNQFVEAFPTDVRYDELRKIYKSRLSGSGENEGLFTEIDTFEVDTGISYVLSHIRKKMDKNHINIFVDTQGGKRIQINTLNGALDILNANEKMKICQLLGIDYNNKNVINEIQDVTETNRIFKRVSDFHEFLNFGKATSMQAFYQGKAEQDVVDKMKEVSDALLVCDMEDFKKKLSSLHKNMNQYEMDTEIEKDPLFTSFLEDIRNHYGLLLGDHHTLISDLKWCIGKELYQQALTLIESKVPAFLVENKMLYYAMDAKERDNAAKIFRKIYGKNNTDISKFKDINHYFVKDYFIYDYQDNLSDENPTEKEIKDKFYIKNNKAQKGKMTSNYAEFLKRQEAVSNRNVVKFYSIYEEKLDEVIQQYLDLSADRNDLAHGHGLKHRTNLEELKSAINDYIQLLYDIQSQYNISTVSAKDNREERMIKTNIKKDWDKNKNKKYNQSKNKNKEMKRYETSTGNV